MSSIPHLQKYLRFAISAVGFPLTCTQAVLSKYDQHRYKPEGKRISIGSHDIHTHVTGQGEYTVILEAGMGGSLLDWSLVQPYLSDDARVVSYDRAGLGWSGGSGQPSTCEHYVEDLRRLLAALDLKPPYLLVGHSFGGMIVRLFAVAYPDDVSGLILVDAVHESHYLTADLTESRRQQQRDSVKLARLGYLLSPIALPRFVGRHIGSKWLPSPALEQVKAVGYRNNTYTTLYAELLDAHESALQLASAEPLRQDLPVIVLSAGRRDEKWKKGQTQMLKLTRRTKQILVEDSWHSIQIHRPEVVIDAIRSLMK